MRPGKLHGGSSRLRRVQRHEISPQDREALLMYLRLCYWRTLNRLDDVLGGMDLTARQFLILKALEENGPCNARSLCTMLSVTPADVTGLSTRLEHKRFVRRVRSMEDRRRVILEITDTGRKALDHAGRKRDKLVDSLISSMPASDFRTLLRGLEQMLEALGYPVRAGKPSDPAMLSGTPAPAGESQRQSRGAPTPSAEPARAAR